MRRETAPLHARIGQGSDDPTGAAMRRSILSQMPHEEARALAEAHVGLEARDPELEIGRGQDVEQALGQAESEARAILDHTLRQAREAALHRLDGVLGREELLDVGFAEIEGHGAG